MTRVWVSVESSTQCVYCRYLSAKFDQLYCFMHNMKTFYCTHVASELCYVL